MSSLIVQILLAAAPYIVPLLIAVLTVVVKAQIQKLPAQQRDLVSNIVQSAVSAVEQMASDQLNGLGKKQLALEFIAKELAHYHIDVPTSVINTMIEQAVLALNTAKSAPTTVVTALPITDTRGTK